jgi:hypothetical protein
LRVGSPFDYQRQAELVLPKGMPDPSGDAKLYEAKCVDMIRRYVDQSDGRAFVLFTSYEAMKRTGAALAELDPRLLRPLQALPAPAISGLALDPAAVLRGRLVHALLQRLCEAPDTDRRSLPAWAARQLATAVPPALHEAALAEAEAVLAAPELRRFFAPGLRAWNEVALPVAGVGDALQLNVLDRLVDDGERLWVLDYKTHRLGAAEAVLAGATEQLRRYVAAVRRLWPQRRVSAGVIWTPTARWLPMQEAS